MRLSVPTALAACCCLVVFGSSADTIHLRDASVIQGKVTRTQDGFVHLETEYTGTLKIPLEGVTGIETDDAQSVTLKSGSRYQGRLRVLDGKQQIDQETGPAPIEISGLSKTEPVVAVEAAPAKANWSGRLELSLKADQGNSENLNVAGGIVTTRTSALDRLTLTLRSQFEESDGVVDKNEAFGQSHYEHDISDSVFFFSRLDLEYDQFESIDLRTRLSFGFGRFLIRNPRQDLKALAGVGYEYERFSDGSSVGTPLGGFGYIYRLSVRDRLRFDSTLVSYFNLTDLGDWRVMADNAAEFPLSGREKWRLRLGVRNEFDSDPLAGVEELDTNYYLSIVYSWD